MFQFCIFNSSFVSWYSILSSLFCFCLFVLCFSIFVIPAVRVNQNSEIDHHKSTTSSIQAYHLVVTSLLGFFLGTVFGAIVFHLFRRHRRRHHHREKQTLFEISTTTNIEVKPNDYLSCDEVIPLPPNLSDDCHTYSTLTFNTKAKDATLKRNVSIQRSESLMRTKLDQPDAFWTGWFLNEMDFEPTGFWTTHGLWTRWILKRVSFDLMELDWLVLNLVYSEQIGYCSTWTRRILNELGCERDECMTFEVSLT